MADLDRELFALLDRAAAGPAAPAPVAEIVRLGRQRRHRRWAAVATAAAAAVVVATGAVVATRLGGQEAVGPLRPTPSPSPTVSATPAPAPTGPTAQQLAAGHWRNVAGAPIDLCPGATAAWDGSELLVVSPQADGCDVEGLAPPRVEAAAYDPKSDRWQRLPDPPRGLGLGLTSVWAGDRLVVVSARNGTAAEYNVFGHGWRRLGSLPAADSVNLSLAWDGTRVVAVGVGTGSDGADVLDDATWEPIDPLPHPTGTSLGAVGAGAAAGVVYAVVSVDTVRDLGAGETSHRSRARLLRLDGLSWTRLPAPTSLPFVAQRIEGYGDRLFVDGSGCPPGASCPVMPPRLLLLRPGTSAATALGISPLRFMGDAAFVAGRSILLYNSGGRETGSGRPVEPGDTAVYDVAAGRWLRAPSSGRIDEIATTTWTPYGLVVLGDPAEKCACSLGGQILRPSRSSAPR